MTVTGVLAPLLSRKEIDELLSAGLNNTTTNKKENNMKNILFIAPSRQYGMTVYRNLQRDLDRNNVYGVQKEYSHKLEVHTPKVTVNIHWWDPVAWKVEDFKDFDAVFGKKELVEKVRETFCAIYHNCPKQAMYKWVVEQNCGEERDVPAPRTQYIPAIKKVHFNDPMTIVLWEDGTKTIVKCQDGDEYSKETGLALCISKKAFGNKGNFNDIFKQWIPEEETDTIEIDVPEIRMTEELGRLIEERVNQMLKRRKKEELL